MLDWWVVLGGKQTHRTQRHETRKQFGSGDLMQFGVKKKKKKIVIHLKFNFKFHSHFINYDNTWTTIVSI